MPILPLFVGALLAETWLLIEVGAHIGGLATIAICVATGFIGGSLAKDQGVRALNRAAERVGRGELPTLEMVDGVFILVAGVVLLTPGYLSDVLGFLLLTPPVRALLRPRVMRWAKGKVKVARASAGRGPRWYGDPAGVSGDSPPQPRPSDDVHDVQLLPPEDRPRPLSERRGPVTIIDP